MERVTEEPNVALFFFSYNTYRIVRHRGTCISHCYFFLADLSLFITTSGWPTWEPTGMRWRRRPWWRPSQRSADMSFLWTSTRWVTCLTRQKQSNYHWCEVLWSLFATFCGLDVGGAGEESDKSAVHHSYSGDACWWNNLAGAWGAVLRASPR